ncbi:MAG: hypothetical protein Q8Q00_00850 [Dehalococcoidia bacterium]|nr:hypothetical protein [Dehalococcoidia bacterium]
MQFAIRKLKQFAFAHPLVEALRDACHQAWIAGAREDPHPHAGSPSIMHR